MGFGPGGGGSGITRIEYATDISFSNPLNGQVLTFDSTVGKWKNATVSGGGGGFIAAKNTGASGALTLTAGSSATLTKFSAVLTANRVITLAGSVANAYFDLSFLEVEFGNYTITITDGVYSHVFSYPTYVRYVYIGSTWERVL
ncbi:hypothetical protein EYC59_04875 [Candidatus Saccharibacteria bacterium]|nr:MAG: hypothetical protein EYC59_04875 [Candidatus Saccharibacteria bacterium]